MYLQGNGSTLGTQIEITFWYLLENSRTTNLMSLEGQIRNFIMSSLVRFTEIVSTLKGVETMIQVP